MVPLGHRFGAIYFFECNLYGRMNSMCLMFLYLFVGVTFFFQFARQGSQVLQKQVEQDVQHALGEHTKQVQAIHSVQLFHLTQLHLQEILILVKPIF